LADRSKITGNIIEAITKVDNKAPLKLSFPTLPLLNISIAGLITFMFNSIAGLITFEQPNS